MSVALLSSLSLVDPQYALNPHHRLNWGRTLWWIPSVEFMGGGNLPSLVRGLDNRAWAGLYVVGGASPGGWKPAYRPGSAMALALNQGTTDKIAIPGSPSFDKFLTAATGTMAIWLRQTVAATSAGSVETLPMLVGDSYNGYLGLKIGITGGNDRIWAYNYDSSERTVGFPYVNNQWYRAVWVHGGGVLYLYVNGVLIGSTAAGNTGSLTLSISDALVSGSAASPFGGMVSDVAIWSRALSASEAWEDYAESISGYPTVLNRMSPQLSVAPSLAVTKFRRTLSDRVGSRGSQ